MPDLELDCSTDGSEYAERVQIEECSSTGETVSPFDPQNSFLPLSKMSGRTGWRNSRFGGNCKYCLFTVCGHVEFPWHMSFTRVTTLVVIPAV